MLVQAGRRPHHWRKVTEVRHRRPPMGEGEFSFVNGDAFTPVGADRFSPAARDSGRPGRLSSWACRGFLLGSFEPFETPIHDEVHRRRESAWLAAPPGSATIGVHIRRHRHVTLVAGGVWPTEQLSPSAACGIGRGRELHSVPDGDRRRTAASALVGGQGRRACFASGAGRSSAAWAVGSVAWRHAAGRRDAARHRLAGQPPLDQFRHRPTTCWRGLTCLH